MHVYVYVLAHYKYRLHTEVKVSTLPRAKGKKYRCWTNRRVTDCTMERGHSNTTIYSNLDFRKELLQDWSITVLWL